MRIEGYCACCLGAVRVVSQNGRILAHEPDTLGIHVSLSPREWNNTNIVHMCDAMNFVADAEHARRYEHQTATRGVLLTLEQTKMFVQNVANERMWNFHWKPGVLNPRAVIKGFRMIVEGDCDHLPEQAFYMVGPIEEAFEKAKALQ
ncbi:MAG: hypothetical protein K6U88_17020 [Dehalococcoidia bacterium]|nr:hypothetical protein [Dehalococcoidia bacterium]